VADPSPLTGAERDAFEAMSYFFRKQAGFSDVDAAELEQFVIQSLQEGHSVDTISLRLQETKAYKERFGKANEERKAQGFRVLSPAEIVGMENEYKALFRRYNLPADMFDTPEELRKYIAADVSGQEMSERLDIARDAVLSSDPSVRQMYRDWYAQGLTEGDAIAAVLDPRGEEAAVRKARAAKLGAYSREQSVGMSMSRAEELANMGVDANREQLGAVRDITRTAGALSARYGLAGGDQRTAEDAVLLGDADARDRIRKLDRAERASFGGSSAGGSGSLGAARY
jgi:hypothetical protein